MANGLTINQIYQVANEIFSQATGGKPLAPVNGKNFVTVAQTALLTGYDPLMNAISQLLSRTIFSIRPYRRKFRGVQKDSIQWGNHVRKLQMVATDTPMQQDPAYTIQNGQSYDMFTVNLPKVLQTNFYGSEVFKKHITRTLKNQFLPAFQSAEEFGRFIEMIMVDVNNQIEVVEESFDRGVIANFIAAKIKADGGNVIHLLTEYNTWSGLNLTAADINNPDNYAPFIRWVYSRIATACEFLTEYSRNFHLNITGSPVNRHTPKDRQNVYLLSTNNYLIAANVLANTFNTDYLKMPPVELLNYWQSIESPSSINMIPAYIDNTGAVAAADEAVSNDKVFGLIVDSEAIGINNTFEGMYTTPLNADALYWNMFWHFTRRYWNDLTENAIVLLLD